MAESRRKSSQPSADNESNHLLHRVSSILSSFTDSIRRPSTVSQTSAASTVLSSPPDPSSGRISWKDTFSRKKKHERGKLPDDTIQQTESEGKSVTGSGADICNESCGRQDDIPGEHNIQADSPTGTKWGSVGNYGNATEGPAAERDIQGLGKIGSGSGQTGNFESKSQYSGLGLRQSGAATTGQSTSGGHSSGPAEDSSPDRPTIYGPQTQDDEITPAPAQNTPPGTSGEFDEQSSAGPSTIQDPLGDASKHQTTGGYMFGQYASITSATNRSSFKVPEPLPFDTHPCPGYGTTNECKALNIQWQEWIITHEGTSSQENRDEVAQQQALVGVRTFIGEGTMKLPWRRFEIYMRGLHGWPPVPAVTNELESGRKSVLSRMKNKMANKFT